MKSEIAFINAFTHAGKDLKGNPCAVIETFKPLSEERMSEIAKELNQPATAFLFKKSPYNYDVRWFAPDAEINLCGHGAAAAGIFLAGHQKQKEITLFYKGGQIYFYTHY